MVRSAIRGRRIGAGPRGDNERGQSVTRIAVTFWCAIGHSTSSIFAASAEVPTTWDCHCCDRPAGLDRDNPPDSARKAPSKSHLAYVRERRSDADAEIILAEALAKLRAAA
ncbi:RNA polymerase-binding protein RbpA [Catenulispora yoronensis]|uniref:RNA polymerase-binding protein RbpA n=1 Tax=Catenulispora yoronensis TaxID=450799 RepID=A0ABP5FBT2_9ACTN